MALVFSACSQKTVETTKLEDAAKVLTEVKTTQFFTDEKVNDEDIEKILSAGVNAPSAMNTQPWHFTAVTDEETQKNRPPMHQRICRSLLRAEQDFQKCQTKQVSEMPRLL